jgi:hypothetical protein
MVQTASSEAEAGSQVMIFLVCRAGTDASGLSTAAIETAFVFAKVKSLANMVPPGAELLEK